MEIQFFNTHLSCSQYCSHISEVLAHGELGQVISKEFNKILVNYIHYMPRGLWKRVTSRK